MTSQYLIPDLKSDEGCRLEAYPDPLSGGDPWTVGYGCTGPDIKQGTVWTQAQAEAALADHVTKVEGQLDASFPWWRSMCDLRQDVLANMTFNMGIGGVSAFHNTLAAMERHDYEAAAEGMMDSLWAKQVGARAKRLSEQMRTGARP